MPARVRTGHPEHTCARDTAPQAAWLRLSSIEWKVRGTIVARRPRRGECGAREPEPQAGTWGQGLRSRPPAEAAIALVMDLVAVVNGLGVAGLGRQGLQVNGLRGPQRLQDGIEPLPRPR